MPRNFDPQIEVLKTPHIMVIMMGFVVLKHHDFVPFLLICFIFSSDNRLKIYCPANARRTVLSHGCFVSANIKKCYSEPVSYLATTWFHTYGKNMKPPVY
jgi:hypothetical protein